PGRHGAIKLKLGSRCCPMALVNIQQAKTHLSQLRQEVEQGQEVAAPGAMHDQIALADDFDAPLDGLFEPLRWRGCR
ncbi:MAG: type II toxin-antitoxin system Phd/YefM family antitoxin, partial [Pirellulaceae bacterium]